jgi:hypothetical protein
VSWFAGRRNTDKASLGPRAPLARTDGLVVEDVGDEVLVYDQRNDQAHCLTREAAMVWRVCDGKTSADELATALELDPETVRLAVEQLDSCGLFDSAPIPGVTRREATIRMAKAGGVAAAAPLIYSIMAPTPALAASQSFCLSISACSTAVNGCDACYKAGCVCCGEGTSSNTKLCTADCSLTNCNPCMVHAHCGGTGTQSSCTCGSSGVPGCKNINHISCPSSNSSGQPCCTPIDANGNSHCTGAPC